MKRAADTIVLMALLWLLLAGSSASPPPVSVDGLSLLIVHETDELSSLTATQRDTILSARLMAGELGCDCWIVDPDQELDGAPQWVRDGMLLPRESLPWMLMVGPRGWRSGPLPDSPEALRALLEEIR